MKIYFKVTKKYLYKVSFKLNYDHKILDVTFIDVLVEKNTIIDVVTQCSPCILTIENVLFQITKL